MYEFAAVPEPGDACWRGRHPSSAEAVRAVRGSVEYRAGSAVGYYLDVTGYDRAGALVLRRVAVRRAN